MLKKNGNTAKDRQQISSFRLWPLACAAGALVLLIPLSFILALHLPSVQKQVIDQVVHQIESVTPVKVELGGYRWLPFSNLRLLDLRVQSAGKEVLRCKKAQVAYRFSSAWPYIVPEEIYLEKPAINLEKDERGKWQLPEAAGAKAGKEKAQAVDRSFLLSFPWPVIRIESGTISAEQGGQKILTVRDITGKLSLHTVSGPDGPKIKVDFGQWGGRLEAPSLGEWRLSGEAEIDRNKLYSSSLVLSLGEKSRICCLGAFFLKPPYDLDLQVELEPLALDSFPELKKELAGLDELSGNLNIKREAGIWHVEHELKTKLGQLTGLVKNESSPEGESLIRLTTRFSDLKIPALSKMGDPRFFGRAEMTLQGEEPKEMRAQVKIDLEPSKWGDQALRKGEISGSYENGNLSLSASGVQSSLGDFSAALSADIEGLWNVQHAGGLKFDLQLDRADLEQVFHGVQQHVGGTIHLEALYAPAQILDWQKWQAKADANITIPGFTSLKAEGTYKDESLDLGYDWDVSDVGKVSAFFPALQGKGRFSSRGSLKGRFPDLVWEGTLDAPLLQYGSIEAEQLALGGKGKITGKEASRKAELKVQSLLMDGMKMGSFDLELDQQEGDCRFELKAEQPWNQLSAKLSGQLEKIWAFPRTLVLNESPFSWKGEGGTIEGRVELDQDRLKFYSLNLQEGKQKARLSGELSFKAKSDLRLALESISLGQWLRVAGLKDEVSGAASGQIHVTGSAEQPEASIDLQVANAAFAVKVPADSPAASPKAQDLKPKVQEAKPLAGRSKTPAGALKKKSLKQGADRKKISAKKKNQASGKAVQAKAPSLAKSGEPESGAKEEALKKAAPAQAGPDDSVVIKESLDRLQLQGTYAKDIVQIRGELQGPISDSPVAISARVPIHLSFKPFSVDFRKTDEWSSTVKTTGFRVERLLPYIDFLDKAGGRMDIDAQIGGSLSRPVVKVDGIWRDGNFEVKGWPHPIEDIQVEWQADSKQIFIRKAQMRHLGGRVDLTGRVEYPDFDVMEYEATGHDLEIPEFWGIKGRGNCEASLKQTAESAQLKAAVHLTKSQMNLRDFESDLARTIEVVGGEGKGDLLMVGGDEKEQNSYYSRLKMDIDVNLPPSATWVRGKGLEAEITGALRLQKAINAPLRLYGGLQALRGTYTFQGNKLNIVDGEIAFFGSPQPDPVLKIGCQKEFKDVTVRANVNGPLSQPKFTLSSVPSMNQVDVLSYLLFGHPAGDLNTNQSQQLQDGAASWLGSQTSTVLKGVFGNTPLTPDTVQYRSTQGEGAVVEIGKYVTPDLYVTYEKGVRGEKENQMDVEYRLNRHLSVQTQLGGTDQSGVDVFWRYDFGK